MDGQVRVDSADLPGYDSNMNRVTVQEIESDPKGFVRRICAGESVIVVRDTTPLAEVTPIPSANGQRPFGLAAGSFTVPVDFDAPLPHEIIEDFEGG